MTAALILAFVGAGGVFVLLLVIVAIMLKGGQP